MCLSLPLPFKQKLWRGILFLHQVSRTAWSNNSFLALGNIQQSETKFYYGKVKKQQKYK